MPKMKLLSEEQQVAVAHVRESRIALEVARRNRNAEVERRLADVRARISIEVADQINALDRALDDAMIDAVKKGVSVRRIAIDGFGATHDGSVRRMIHEAMADDRDESYPVAARAIALERVSGNSSLIPEPISVEDVERSVESRVAHPPQFALANPEHVLYEDAEQRITVPTVSVQIDSFDPWVASMSGMGRKGSTTLAATVCTFYRHPGTGKMVAVESPESGDTFYDHLAARWVKMHQAEAAEAYANVLLDAGIDLA